MRRGNKGISKKRRKAGGVTTPTFLGPSLGQVGCLGGSQLFWSPVLVKAVVRTRGTTELASDAICELQGGRLTKRAEKQSTMTDLNRKTEGKRDNVAHLNGVQAR